jgi:hypothetical protein
MRTGNEVVKLLRAALYDSRLSGRDIRVVVEEMADQLGLINDNHRRQLALAKATLDAKIDVLKREMASTKLDIESFKKSTGPWALNIAMGSIN